MGARSVMATCMVVCLCASPGTTFQHLPGAPDGSVSARTSDFVRGSVWQSVALSAVSNESMRVYLAVSLGESMYIPIATNAETPRSHRAPCTGRSRTERHLRCSYAGAKLACQCRSSLLSAGWEACCSKVSGV